MERQIAILAVVAVLAAPAVAVTVQQQAQADMRLCMQRAAAGTDAGELTAANLRETEEELAVLRRENAELRKDRATLAAMLSRAYAH